MAHAEGRFTHEDPAFFAATGCGRATWPCVYTALGGRPGSNPNGSLLDTAGLTNVRGNVLAMMPHPERAAQLRHGAGGPAPRLGAGRLAAAGRPGAAGGGRARRFLLRRLVEMC